MHVARAALLSASIVVAALGCQSLLDVEPDPARTDGGASEPADGGRVDDVAAGDVFFDVTNDAGKDAGPDAPVTCLDASATPYQQAVLASGPIAYFPLNETPGTALIANATCGAQGARGGAVALGEQGIDGTGAAFPGGSNDWIDLGDAYDFVNGAPFSIETWARPVLAFNQYNNLLMKTASSDGYALFAIRGNGYGQMTFHVGGPDAGVNSFAPLAAPGLADASADASVDVGWIHVVGTFDGTSLRLYVDGNAFDPQTATQLPTDHTGRFRIGFVFHGYLDEVAIYDRALAPNEIMAHYKVVRP